MGRIGNRVAVVVTVFLCGACFQEQVRRPAAPLPATVERPRFTFAHLQGNTVQVHVNDTERLFANQPQVLERARFVVVNELDAAGIRVSETGTRRLDVTISGPGLERPDGATECVKLTLAASMGSEAFLPGAQASVVNCSSIATAGGSSASTALFYLGAALVQLAVTEAVPHARAQALFDSLSEGLPMLDRMLLRR